MIKIKDRVKDIFGGIRRFSREHNQRLTAILVVSRMIVFLTFIVVALVMYNIGNRLLSGILVLAVSLYMIFNKMESMSRGF